MADHRTKRQKLEAMASQTVSPHEAEVARRLLARMGHTPPPAPRQRPQPIRVVYQTWATSANAYTYFYGDGEPVYRTSSSWGAWNPIPDAEEPHWFEEWFSSRMRQQGADARDIENAIREMRRKMRWQHGADGG